MIERGERDEHRIPALEFKLALEKSNGDKNRARIAELERENAELRKIAYGSDGATE